MCTTAWACFPAARVTRVTTIGVAIAIPEPYGSELQRCRISFGDASAGGIPTHVTLLPPTEVDDADLPAIESHLYDVAAGRRPFVLHLRGTGTFRPVSPVVFIAVVEGISACEVLTNAVRSGPLDRELSFPYHPHVTLAQQISDEALDAAFVALADFDCAFSVPAFSLYVHGDDDVWRESRTFELAAARVR
jgi:2'-5' RNA ligase